MAGFWKETGRSALFAALAAACDQADDNFLEYVKTKDQECEDRHHQELDKLRSDAEKARACLEAEIRTLKDTVTSLEATIASHQQSQNGRSNETNGYGLPRLRAVHDCSLVAASGSTGGTSAELQQSLAKLRTRYEDLREQLGTALSVARKRKSETLSWVQYADSLERKIQKLKKKRSTAHPTYPTSPGAIIPDTSSAPGSPSTPAVQQNILPSTPDALPQEAAEGPSRPDLSASFASVSAPFLELGNRHDPTLVDDEREKATEVEETLPTINCGIGITTSQPLPESTQGEPSSDEPLSDLPAKDRADTQPGGQPGTKTEHPLSDGPEVIFERPAKKRRQDGVTSLCPAPALTDRVVVKDENGSSVGLSRSILVNSQESLDLDEGQLIMATPRKRHLIYCDQPSSDEVNNPAASMPDIEGPSGSEAGGVVSSGVLAPSSTNIQHKVGSYTKRISNPARHARQLALGVDSVAEDGSVVSEGREKEHRRLWLTPGSERLKSLLNSRPPEPSPVLPVSNPTRVNPANSSTSGVFGKPLSTQNFPRPRHAGMSPTPIEGLSTPLQLTTSHQEDTGRRSNGLLTPTASRQNLRSRRAHELKLEDFKINPAFNDGQTFAYNEVVRSRSDRLNLPGCIDMQCCGKAFRSMAESELNAAGPTHISRTESTVMMEQYLGDEAFVLARLSPGEKRNMWIEARTKQLADKYGKHRHRYHRRASPPGFWDADFPTTQEEEENRIESERIEKEIIQERLREAMRPGGRWLFRDE